MKTYISAALRSRMSSLFGRFAWKALIALALTVAVYHIKAQSANTIADETAYGRTASNPMEILGPPPMPLGAVSVKTHCCLTSAQDFPIDLPLTGPVVGIECRKGGGVNFDTHLVIVTFDVDVTNAGSATVTGEIGVPAAFASPGPGSRDVTVNLTSVANMQTIMITLSGVNGTGSAVIPMGILCGDTQPTRSVNSTDVAQTKFRSGPVTSATFRSDVNHDGLVNSGDTIIVLSKSGTALP